MIDYCLFVSKLKEIRIFQSAAVLCCIDQGLVDPKGKESTYMCVCACVRKSNTTTCTHTHTLSLSLTHTHTHTHTDSCWTCSPRKEVRRARSILDSSPFSPARTTLDSSRTRRWLRRGYQSCTDTQSM